MTMLVILNSKVEKRVPREPGSKRRGGEGEDGGAEVEGKEGTRRLVSRKCDFNLSQLGQT